MVERDRESDALPQTKSFSLSVTSAAILGALKYLATGHPYGIRTFELGHTTWDSCLYGGTGLSLP